MSSYELIASLGSSFAAGPGIAPIEDSAAMRSGRNYAHQLAERLSAHLVDLTVSGATTANVIGTPQQLADGSTRPPQTEGIPPEADLVTVTAGGNDLQFAGAMLFLAWQRHDPESPMVQMLGQMFAGGIPAPTRAAVEAATAGLVTVVERVREQAPTARVVLVDYLTVLDDASVDATPFTKDELDEFLTIQRAIGRVFADAAARTGADIVLASALSIDHALGSMEPWVQPFHSAMTETGGSFHPNEAGMTAIAVELERVLTA